MTQGLSPENQLSADLRAQHYLLNEFGLKKIIEGKRLPTVKYLAQQAGVSTKALCIALSIFEKQGIITITKAGTFRGQMQKINGAQSAPLARTLRKGERVLEQMRDDIRNGRFLEGEALPDMQKLSEIYNVSRPTLIKSLAALLKEEVLLRHLASYMVPRSKQFFPSAAVLVVCTQTLSGSPALSGQRALQLLSPMQWECRERMLHLEVSSYGEHEPALAFPQRINLVHHRAAFMGYVVIASYMGDSGVRAVLKELAPYKRPIALIDELGKLTIPDEYKQRRDIQIFNITNYGAGVDVAKMLQKANHSHIAWVSPYHSHAWSRERLRGITESFVNDREAHKISTHTFEGFYDVLHFAYALFDDDTKAFELIENHISPFYAPTIKEHFEKVCASKPWAHVKPERLLSLRKTMRYIADSVKAEISVDDFTAVKDLIYGRCAYQACGVFLEPAFDAALAEKECTAWVCCNDEIASLALKHLETRKVPHAKRPSITGFDNSALAYELSITSYDFNFSGLAPLLLRFLLDPKGYQNTKENAESLVVTNDAKSAKRHSYSPQRPPGFIVERFSTRMLRR